MRPSVCIAAVLGLGSCLWQGAAAQDQQQQIWQQPQAPVAPVGMEMDLAASQDAPVADVSAAASRNRRRRRRKNKNRQKQRDYAEEDYEEYDRDDSYGSPKAPAYEAPAPSYEAPAPSYSPPSYSPPSYNPPSYSAPHDSYGAPAYSDGGGGGDNSFNDFLNALAAFLPIGLFLAAIPPNIITINDGRKKRSFGDENEVYGPEVRYTYPFLDEFQQMGYTKLEDPHCQKKIFCQMAVRGGHQDANTLQKMFHYGSNLFPAFFARPIGMDELLGAIQHEQCDSFKCN